MEVRISSEALNAIRAHAAEAPNREVCGLLFGQDASVTATARTRNVAHQPHREFEIDPAALIAAHRAERAGGPKLLGCYHSHPNSSAVPSPKDRDQAAQDGKLWIIVGGHELRAWRAEENGFCEVHVRGDEGKAIG